MKHWGIIAILFIVPLSFLATSTKWMAEIFPMGDVDVWYFQWMFLLFSSCCFYFIRYMKFNWAYGLFGLVCTYSAFFVGGQHPRCIMTLFQVILATLGIKYVSKMEEKEIKKVLTAVLVLTFLQAFWVVLQSINKDPFFHMVGNVNRDDTVGFSGSHNQIGIFFSIITPLVASRCFYFLPLVAFCLVKSTTSFAVMGSIVSGAFLIYWKWRKYFLHFVLVSLIGSFFYTRNVDHMEYGLFAERIGLWHHIIKSVNSGEIKLNKDGQHLLVTTNKWKGYGLGNFMRVSPYAQKEDFLNDIYYWQVKKWGKGAQPEHVFEHAHNDYLETLFDLGYAGFISMFLAIGWGVWKFIKAKKSEMLVLSTACLIGQMVPALGVYTVQTAISGMLLILFLGIFEKYSKRGIVWENFHIGHGVKKWYATFQEKKSMRNHRYLPAGRISVGV